jgi:NAD+ synthase (glutamine-hydrolysing)
MRLGLAQIDTCVGDFAGNAELVLRWAHHARRSGVHLLAFPEMTLTGYPAEDLVLRESFVHASVGVLDHLAYRLAEEGLGELAVIVGFLDHGVADRPGNAAAVLHGGQVVARYAKHHLPNYGVFDEYRYFRPGSALPVVRLHGIDVSVVICEDLWQEGGPLVAATRARAGLLVALNASPYERGKSEARLALLQTRARQAGAVLAYVNLVGGQDELVFDGDSVVVDPEGNVIARSPQFEEGLLLADLRLPLATSNELGAIDVGDGSRMIVERVTVSNRPVPAYPAEPSTVAPRMGDEAEVYAALVLSTRDYAVKNGFRSVILGLSGGIDSALVATIATDALGAEAVHAVALPSRYSSDHSLDDAEDLAKRQGIHFQVVPIAPMVDAFEATLELTGLAAENLQARIRGTTLMALSNQFGHLVLTTGNKSELATGYSTLYGDSAGGFGPIKDVPKTLVWALARWRNETAVARGELPPIPENCITKAPSAELRPGQLDSDSLPPYDALDRLLEDYVESNLGREALLDNGHDPALIDLVLLRVDLAEFKRRQYPPGPKISPHNFGRGRRLPITSAWRERLQAPEPTP